MRGTWITWEPRGRDAYTNPRARVAHLSEARRVSDAGGSPLACGRWAPEDFDAIFTEASHGRRCKRCERSTRRREPEEA